MYTAAPGTDVGSLLARADEHLARAEMNLRATPLSGAYSARLVSRVGELKARQQQLAGASEADGALGWIPLVLLGAGVAAAAGGGLYWVYKQVTDSEDIDSQTEAYRYMIEEGVDRDKAAKWAYGESGISDALTKITILSAILAGVYVFAKLR